MKKFKLNLVWVLIAAIFATSACKKDDSSTPLIEDGGYIVGTSTTSSDLDLKGMMSAGLVEGEGYAATPRDGMYEKFTYINSTGDGFHFVVKNGAEELSYGFAAATKGTITLDGTVDDQIAAVIDTGAVVLDGANITVATSGFYHIVLDVPTMSYYVIPVNNWNIKLAEDIEMTPGTISQTGASWSKTDVELRKGTYKLRYDKGWKVYASKGTTNQFIIFTNFGGTIDALALGGGNIPLALADEGKYTVTLNWSPTAGFTAALTDKVAVVPVDPATFVWSIVGNAFYLPDGVTVANWGDYEIALPYISKSGNVYSYKANNVQLLAGGAFKIRKDHLWANTVGFNGTTILGDPSNFTASNDGNFVVTATKTYNITYDLDWANDTNTVTFTVVTK